MHLSVDNGQNFSLNQQYWRIINSMHLSKSVGNGQNSSLNQQYWRIIDGVGNGQNS